MNELRITENRQETAGFVYRRIHVRCAEGLAGVWHRVPSRESGRGVIPKSVAVPYRFGALPRSEPFRVRNPFTGSLA